MLRLGDRKDAIKTGRAPRLGQHGIGGLALRLQISTKHIFLISSFEHYEFEFFLLGTAGVYISFETHIFAPPPFFRIIFFPPTHGLKTGVFDRFLMPALTSKNFFGF